jgi:hypothetical protein
MHWETLLRSARPAFRDRGRLDEFREISARLAGEIADAEVAAGVWIALGRDYRDAGDEQRAADCFRRALARDPGPSLSATARAALREIDRLAAGRRAPAFSAVDLWGSEFRSGELRGRAVLLQFWSVDCEGCFRELDRLQGIRASYPRSRLELITVALESDREVVLRIVEGRKADWVTICEPPRDGGTPLERLFEVRELPQAFLIDAEGRIVLGTADGAELEAALADLLAETEKPAVTLSSD